LKVLISRSKRAGLMVGLLFALAAVSPGSWSTAAPRLNAQEAAQPEAKNRKLEERIRSANAPCGGW
jgi:hypothetical protein